MARNRLIDQLKKESQVDLDLTQPRSKKIIFVVSEEEKNRLDKICVTFNKSKQELIYKAMTDAGLFEVV